MHFAFSTSIILLILFFFFNDTATTEIYTLSLHYSLPISSRRRHTRLVSDWSSDGCRLLLEIGRAHGCTPVTDQSRMPGSGLERKSRSCSAGDHSKGQDWPQNIRTV